MPESKYIDVIIALTLVRRVGRLAHTAIGWISESIPSTIRSAIAKLLGERFNGPFPGAPNITILGDGFARFRDRSVPGLGRHAGGVRPDRWLTSTNRANVF
jgi:hypothetical protein